MASINDSSIKFFSKANSDQWLFVLSQYKEVFKARAQATRGSKKSGPQEAIKLDNWYQEDLPKLLQSRKDKHVRHEELVQITKWKLWRTKNRAGLLDLVRMNTETAVKQVSTKAFKKCPTNLQGAISALVNLKGIGVATASAILCACFPEICPFMADECLDSVPGIENTNYTVNEFIAFADQIKACCERLQAEDPTAKWTPHKVELTLWTHYWIKEMKLNLLEKMPTPEGLDDEVEETGSNDVKNSKSNGDSHKLSSSSATNGSSVGGAVVVGGGNGEKVLDEDSNISVPVSNASEVEEGKSNEEDEEDDDSRSGDVARRDNNGTSRNMSKNNLHMINNSNTNSSSAYNCIDDSNLSYSNLSSDDLNNSTTENTADNTLDGPTNLTTNTTTTTTTATNSTTTISNNNTTTNNSNNTNNCSSSSSSSFSSSSTPNVSTTSSLSPLAPPPPPPVAAVPVCEGGSEPISTTNNGHVDVNSNGENCKKMDRNNEIRSETVCSSMDDVVSSNSIKRPLEEISSTGDGLGDGSIDKKTRIE